MLALASALGGDATCLQRLLFLAGDVARVVLVNVQLPIHPERIGIRAQETLDVGVAWKLVELLGLERAEVFSPHFRPELHLVEIEALARAGLAEA